MDDFATKKTKPTAEEYLNATDEQLLQRLNNNPSNVDSEFAFMSSLITVRTARAQRKANDDLIRQTRYLVYATSALCVVTIGVALISYLCR